MAPATEAKQDIGNTSLNSMDLKLPNQVASSVPVMPLDYGIAVARGLIVGVTTKTVNGYNNATPTSLEPIWSHSAGSYPWPTAAVTLTVGSSNANDTSAGSGARSVLITYIDATTFAEVQTIVALNGTTPVTITTNCWRVNDFRVYTTGSTTLSGSNAGVLWLGYGAFVSGTGHASQLSRIYIGENVHQQAIYTVPVSKVFEAIAFRVSLSNAARFRLTYRLDGQTGFTTAFNMPLSTSVAITSPFTSNFPAKTDILVAAQSLGGTIQTGMIMSGYLRSI